MSPTSIESLLQITVDVSSTGIVTKGDRAGDPRGTNGNDERTSIDYSEEAIPERDPGFSLLDLYSTNTQTIEVVPAEVRRDLARRLERLGMKPRRAALVASL